MAAPEACLPREHLRAICDEIGDRFRHWLDIDASDPPQRIKQLLVLLELSEKNAPSLVPSAEPIAERTIHRGELVDA